MHLIQKPNVKLTQQLRGDQHFSKLFLNALVVIALTVPLHVTERIDLAYHRLEWYNKYNLLILNTKHCEFIHLFIQIQ